MFLSLFVDCSSWDEAINTYCMRFECLKTESAYWECLSEREEHIVGLFCGVN